MRDDITTASRLLGKCCFINEFKKRKHDWQIIGKLTKSNC